MKTLTVSVLALGLATLLDAQAPATGFHHLHLNSVDPVKAIDWYTKTFPVTTRATLAGFEGIANGVTFATPLSKLASGTVFAYMKAPDDAMVEINSAQSRAFVHVHLYSEAPLCAADWYEQHLAGTRRATRPEGPCNVPFGAPSEPLVPSPGHVVDHIALSVSDLVGTLARLQAAGVKVLRGVHAFGNGSIKAALIEGPDSIAIELVERP